MLSTGSLDFAFVNVFALVRIGFVLGESVFALAPEAPERIDALGILAVYVSDQALVDIGAVSLASEHFLVSYLTGALEAAHSVGANGEVAAVVGLFGAFVLVGTSIPIRARMQFVSRRAETLITAHRVCTDRARRTKHLSRRTFIYILIAKFKF